MRLFSKAIPKKYQSRTNVLRRGLLGLALVAGILGLSGCRETEGPDLTEIMALNWAPIGGAGLPFLTSSAPWRQVNIDDNEEPEYLLLYTYGTKDMYPANDGFDLSEAEPVSGAPVGAVIYKALESAEYVVGSPFVATPLQPTAAYIPYRIAPSYWPSPNTGYVAQYRNPDAIIHTEYATDSSGLCPVADVKSNELAIYDSEKTLTVVWWRNPYEGFGATQLTAPGGFRAVKTNGPNDAVELKSIAAPIWSIDALYPLTEPQNLEDLRVAGGFADPQRSLLCRVFRYYRESATSIQSDDHRIDVTYVDDDLGIQFCRNGEPDPFFPEAVALRFLRNKDDRMNLLDSKLDQPTKDRIVQNARFLDLEREREVQICQDGPQADTIALPRFRVNALETRAVVPYRERDRRTPPVDPENVPRLLSFVCAEIAPVDPGAPLPTPEDPDLADLAEIDAIIDRTRLLFFSLEHEAPSARDINGTTVHFTDRFYIVDLEDATGWGYDDCKSLLAADAYGQRGGAP
jgi:hypothetical protein